MEKKVRHGKEKKSARSAQTLPSAENEVDVSQVFSMLQKVIPEVEKKKTKDMTADEKYSHLSNWSFLRPNMSFDFAVDHAVFTPPISVIPWQSQENIILDDLLSVLEGFQGKYIVAQPLLGKYGPRQFTVADSVEPTLRHMVEQMLPLASNHSIVTRFIEEKRQLKWGRVNQALAAAMDKFLADYSVFISQLENLLRKNQLTLQNMWFYLQSTMQTFQVLAKIATTINQYEAIGGKTLTILHEETLHYITDNNAQKLCMHLTEKAADPYFDSLQRWLHKGIVFDPYSEFLVNDNVAIEVEANTMTGQYSDQYWRKRYIISEENVPVFLTQVEEIILRTGRYLNVVRQCSETTKTSVDLVFPPVEKLVYSLHGEQYLTIIESAYQFASSTLLNLLLTEYDIINRIKSLKRYFLMEQGDFIVQLLDLCEDELLKPISDVVPSRLQSLFELALRTSTGKHDPYKEDMTLTILTETYTHQILTIQTISSEEEEQMRKDKQFQAFSKTGLEGFAFQVVSKWPLSLLFNQKIIGCYQMLFRHLVHCKHVDRRLCRVWISDKAVKQLPVSAAAGYLGAFSLRQRMLFCVQNLEYYMMEEAIEPNWIRFMSRLPNVKNIDDLLSEHWDFVDLCMKDCMFMNHDLIAIINKILAACIEFCDFIQRMQRYYLDAELTSMLSPDDRPDDCASQSSDGVYSRAVENQSFENNIKRLDKKFTCYLVTLLTTISSLGQEETVEKLRNILYRQNFNGFYSSDIENDYRGNDSETSASSSVKVSSYLSG